MNDTYIAITNDLNFLSHFGTRGMKKGVWGGNGKKYQNHAVYARFDKRYKNPITGTYEKAMTEKRRAGR